MATRTLRVDERTAAAALGRQRPEMGLGDVPPRRNSFVWLAVAVAAVVIGFVLWGIVGIHTAHPPPSATERPLAAPTAGWILEGIGAALFLVLIAAAVRSVMRTRRLAFWVLMLLAGTSMFWQEFYSDWAAYVVWNPRFHRMPWHGTLFTTPNKPWLVIPLYGYYLTLAFTAIPALVAFVRRARPRWHRTAVFLGVTIPVFYGMDFLFEGGIGTRLGWWTYLHHIGPAITSSKGVYPYFSWIFLVLLFDVVACWVIDQRDDCGRFRLEVLSRALNVREGWRRETARAFTWIFVMNALFLVLLTGPLVVIRALWGSGSPLVP
jgi:hypothetical protein